MFLQLIVGLDSVSRCHDNRHVRQVPTGRVRAGHGRWGRVSGTSGTRRQIMSSENGRLHRRGEAPTSKTST
jgi:hypothetical protein